MSEEYFMKWWSGLSTNINVLWFVLFNCLIELNYVFGKRIYTNRVANMKRINVCMNCDCWILKNFQNSGGKERKKKQT